MKSIDSRLKEDGMLKSASSQQLQFMTEIGLTTSVVSDSILPVVYDSRSIPQLLYFSMEDYWSNLSSKVLGNTLFVADVVSTTTTVFES